MKTLKLIKPDEKDCIEIREEDIAMDFMNVINNDILAKATYSYINIRLDGNFKGKALRLDSIYDYVLGKDENDKIILIPLKKK